ncbi:TspO/MBR family protein [Acuticoccus sp.]|uniref:TspO/MBR family protein n=1 Tax=Acuticoccus sp. TaxID=1904378 RepID=UPI003B51D32F
MGGIEDWGALLAFVAVNFAAASTGGIFRPGTWYEELRKPSWTPPNWLFAPAWTVLYALIAYAGYLVWRSAAPGEATVPLIVYGVHLALNASWSAIFFGLKRVDLAFLELVVFWLSIVATIALFYQVRVEAALILLPYLAWVTFAGALNLAIWRMNAPIRQPAV